MNEHITIDRSLYDKANEVKLRFKAVAGVTEDVVRNISVSKNEPQWMLDLRLKSLAAYHKTHLP